MLASMSYFLSPTECHFNASCCARVKMNAERGPKHIYAMERKLHYYYCNIEGHWEIMNLKKQKE